MHCTCFFKTFILFSHYFPSLSFRNRPLKSTTLLSILTGKSNTFFSFFNSMNELEDATFWWQTVVTPYLLCRCQLDFTTFQSLFFSFFLFSLQFWQLVAWELEVTLRKTILASTFWTNYWNQKRNQSLCLSTVAIASIFYWVFDFSVHLSHECAFWEGNNLKSIRFELKTLF